MRNTQRELMAQGGLGWNRAEGSEGEIGKGTNTQCCLWRDAAAMAWLCHKSLSQQHSVNKGQLSARDYEKCSGKI